MNANGKDIDALLERAKKEFFVDHDMWNYQHEKNGLKVFTAPPEEKGATNYLKVIGDVKVKAPKILMDAVHTGDLDLRQIWDPDCKLIEHIETEGDEDVARVVIKSPSRLVWERDFVYRRKVYPHPEKKDSYYSVTASTLHDKAPEDKANYVRGTLNVAAWFFEKIDDETVRVIYILQSNPAGNIPAWVTNQMITSQALCVERLRNIKE